MKGVDRFNDLTVTAHVMSGINVRFLLLNNLRGSDDAIKNFLTGAQELFLKVSLNPFFEPIQPITSKLFRARIQQLAQRYFA